MDEPADVTVAEGWDSLVGQVADEFLARQERGERPDIEEYAARHPEQAGLIRNVLRTMRLIEGSGGGAGAAGEVSGTLGDYRLIREVGRGGMGVVYEAEQISLGRRVALKVLPFASTMDARRLQRFKNEARAAASLEHPHIVPVYGVGTERGVHYYAMKYIEGRTLADVIAHQKAGAGEPTTDAVPREGAGAAETARPGPTQAPRDAAFFRRAAEWGAQAAEALEYAHSMGVVHRDVKPANLMVDGEGKLWVADFGLARRGEEDGVTATGDVLGTLRYSSPEQALARHGLVDHRTDVYALGATLYELLAGRPAVEGKDRAEILANLSGGEPVAPRRHERAVPADLETVVLKALSKEPGDRYRGAGEMAKDLRRWLEDRPIEARPPSLAKRVGKFVARHRSVVAAVGIGLLACVAVLGAAGGYVARDRAAQRADAEREKEARQDRVADRAGEHLAEAARLMKGSKWREALAAAKRAEAALAAGEADDGTREKVEAAVRDLEFVARLGRIRMNAMQIQKMEGMQVVQTSEGEFRRGAIKEYADAFRAHGVDIDRLSAEQAVTRLKQRPAIALALADALDHWAQMRHNHPENDGAGWKTLLQVADGLDPDPFRGELRQLVGRQATPEVLRRLRWLAVSVEAKSQSPAGLLNLAGYLRAVNQVELAAQILGSGLHANPEDFWMNLELGYLLYRKRDYTGAIRFTNAAVALRPDFSAPRVNLGAALSGQRMHDEALAVYRKAREIDPTKARILIDIGSILEVKGELDEALKYFRTAVEVDPGLAFAHSSLGSALRKQGKFAEGMLPYRRAVELDPKQAMHHSNLACALADLGQWNEAFASCREAIKLDPGFAPAHSALGTVHHNQGRPDEAIASYRRAIELDPSFASPHTDLGVTLMGQGKLDEAIACHSRAIELDPRNAKAHSNLGVAFARQGKLDEAVGQYRKAIEINPRLATAYTSLGTALFKQGKRDEAVAAYRKAIEVDPREAMAHDGLGHVFHQQGKLDEAYASCLEAVRLNPGLALYHVNLGIVLLAQGKLDEAATSLRKGVELDSKHGDAMLLLGVALHRQLKYDEAIVYYRKAMVILPHHPILWSNLAWLLSTHPDAKRRDPVAAVALARKAEKRLPRTSGCMCTLGTALYRAGEWKEAAAFLEKSLKLPEVNRRPSDFFFLAMAQWHLGDKKQARQRHEQGVAWMKKHQKDPMNESLLRFRAESEELLGLAPKLLGMPRELPFISPLERER